MKKLLSYPTKSAKVKLATWIAIAFVCSVQCVNSSQIAELTSKFESNKKTPSKHVNSSFIDKSIHTKDDGSSLSRILHSNLENIESGKSTPNGGQRYIGEWAAERSKRSVTESDNADSSESLKRPKTNDKKKTLERLTAECIEAIKSQDFKTAEDKLKEIDNDNRINLIVRDLYNHHVANFDLLLKFGDNVVSSRRSFLILKALNFELDSNGHNDVFKMIKLVNSLNKKVMYPINTPSGVKDEARALASNLKKKIETVAEEKLKNGFMYDRYSSVANIANEVFIFDSKLFGSVIKKVVNNVYGRIETKKLLSNIRNQNYIGQIIHGCSAMLDFRYHAEK